MSCWSGKVFDNIILKVQNDAAPNSGKKVIELLADKYRPVKLVNAISVLLNLLKTQYTANSDPQHLFNTVDALIQRLLNMNMLVRATSETFNVALTTFIMSKSPDYAGTLDSLLSKTIDPTLAEIQHAIIEKYRRQLAIHSASTSSTANSVLNFGKQMSKNDPCENCGKKGHLTAECRGPGGKMQGVPIPPKPNPGQQQGKKANQASAGGSGSEMNAKGVPKRCSVKDCKRCPDNWKTCWNAGGGGYESRPQWLKDQQAKAKADKSSAKADKQGGKGSSSSSTGLSWNVIKINPPTSSSPVPKPSITSTDDLSHNAANVVTKVTDARRVTIHPLIDSGCNAHISNHKVYMHNYTVHDDPHKCLSADQGVMTMPGSGSFSSVVKTTDYDLHVDIGNIDYTDSVNDTILSVCKLVDNKSIEQIVFCNDKLGNNASFIKLVTGDHIMIGNTA